MPTGRRAARRAVPSDGTVHLPGARAVSVEAADGDRRFHEVILVAQRISLTIYRHASDDVHFAMIKWCGTRIDAELETHVINSLVCDV